MFESIFTSTADNSINISQAAISLGASIVIGVIIAIVYMYISKKEGYQKNFIIGLLMLPAVVSVVILLVGSNVARAFSMAGAFALVRFRSVPGDSKDIASVFFAMAVGLATGLGYISFAVIFTGVIGGAYLLLMLTGYGIVKNLPKTLRITIPENLNFNGTFDEVFNEYTTDVTLEKVRTTNLGSMYELTYNISLKKDADQKKFIDDLRCRNGNLNITLCNAETKELL